MFYRDMIGYEPKLMTAFKMDHLKRGECEITIGIGSISSPIQTKRFDDWISNGGDHPFCSNNIVLDITEFEDAVPTVINQSFFMKIYDGASSTTGTVTSFSIEYYSSYNPENLKARSMSDDVPVSTINYDYAFAELTLSNPHNIGITDVFTSKTVVGQGFSLRINVSISNYGNATETFNVTIHADTTLIDKFVDVTLVSNDSTILVSVWNTAGFAKGNYTITVYASPVLGEINISDNISTECWIIITIPGDVDGDFQFDIYDIVRICAAYGSELGDLEYEANCDVDGDGDVDIYDVVIACNQYGIQSS